MSRLQRTPEVTEPSTNGAPAKAKAAAEAAAAEAAPAPALDDPSLYINRELSWLAFNARVLDQAVATHVPLLERLKFVAIHASNLDEFFMIRVSGLHEQLEAALVETNHDGLSPREQLDRIAVLVRGQLETAARVLEQLLPALAEHGIHIRRWSALDAGTRRHACTYFRKQVFPVLTPLAVDPGHPFPFLSNLSLSLAVEVRDPDTGELRFARVKVPESLPRFVPLARLGAPPAASDGQPRSQEFLPLEDLIAANLDDLFPGTEIVSHHPFRVTRDMDISILEDEAHDLLSIVDREVRRRRFGAPVRLEVDPAIPARIRKLLCEKMEIDETDVYEGAGPLGLSALMSIALLPHPTLHDPPFAPRLPAALADQRDLFAAVRAGDILLHHPYDSFSPVLEFLRAAAEDRDVLAIKMTLYRAGSNAEAVKTLIRAAENGKQVAVSIELKARFDEENNIAWARALERVGAHVFFGDAVMKTHAKAVLVVRREGEGMQRYVHLSTGNYNAGTARLYTDLGLLTARPQIGEDVSELFNSLSGFSKAPRYRALAVAPRGLADAVLAQIAQQAERARAGQPSRIFAKLNALVDVRVIQALYRASQAGVPIILCVRGVCCLRPGVPGVSSNIRVVSAVGRFLEHERVFLFGPEGDEAFFLSSADWMPRNLNRRVELLFPIDDPALREQIRQEVVAPVLADNSRIYEMDAAGDYRQRQPAEGEPARNVQADVLERVAKHTQQVVATG
jgi:polyphosphate kinase